MTQAWTIANVLRTQIEFDKPIANGLKFDISATLHPDKGTKTSILNAVYKQPGIHSRAFVDLFKVSTA